MTTATIHCATQDIAATIEIIKGDGGKVIDILPYKQFSDKKIVASESVTILTTIEVVIIYESE